MIENTKPKQDIFLIRTLRPPLQRHQQPIGSRLRGLCESTSKQCHRRSRWRKVASSGLRCFGAAITRTEMQNTMGGTTDAKRRVQIAGIDRVVYGSTTRDSGSSGGKVVTLTNLKEFQKLAAGSFMKLLKKEPGQRHVPWDEVELKKHCLINTVCERYSDDPPKDEFEMRRAGFLTTNCNRPRYPNRIAKGKSSAASVAEELHKGVPRTPLSEYGEKSWAEHKIVQANAKKLAEVFSPACRNDSSSPSSCTLLSGGIEEEELNAEDGDKTSESSVEQSSAESEMPDAKGPIESSVGQPTGLVIPLKYQPLDPPPIIRWYRHASKKAQSDAKAGSVTIQQKESVEKGDVKVIRFDFNVKLAPIDQSKKAAQEKTSGS